MKQRTIFLLGVPLLFLIACSAAWFHHQHSSHLHRAAGSIPKEDHDLFMRSGIDCEEVYHVQGYEGPEAVLRMYSMTQLQFRQLNPGVGFDPQPGTTLCTKGKIGVSTHVTPFHWFWPITLVVCALIGFCVLALIKWAYPLKPAAKGEPPAAVLQQLLVTPAPEIPAAIRP